MGVIKTAIITAIVVSNIIIFGTIELSVYHFIWLAIGIITMLKL